MPQFEIKNLNGNEPLSEHLTIDDVRKMIDDFYNKSTSNCGLYNLIAYVFEEGHQNGLNSK